MSGSHTLERFINEIARDVIDPPRTYVPPTAQDSVPHLNFAPLQNVLTQLEASVRSYGDALSPEVMAQLSVADQRALDQILIRTEPILTREAIEQRDWPLATSQIALAADTLGRFAAQVDRATDLLRRSR
jgi:N-acetylated-alpha-linked acidic dipeptidase